MGAIKVHGSAMSTATQRVFTCLYEKELDFEFVPVDMASREHRKEPYLSLNPFGQVPALEHGDLKIFESRAITQYIAMEYPDRGTRLASADKPSSSFLIWKEVEAHQFDPVASKLTWEIVLKPVFGMAIDPAVAEEYKAKLANVLDVYEARLTKFKYLVSDSFTLVDMHHLPTINILMGTQVRKLFEAYPRVSTWIANITARPAWAKVQMISKTNELHRLTDEVSLRKERDRSLYVSDGVRNVRKSISGQSSGGFKNVHESISGQPSGGFKNVHESISGQQRSGGVKNVHESISGQHSGGVKNVYESISGQTYDQKTFIQHEQFRSSKSQVMQEQLITSHKELEYLEAKQSHSQPVVAASSLMDQTKKLIVNFNDIDAGANSDGEGGADSSDVGGANSNEYGAANSDENDDPKLDNDGDQVKLEIDITAKSNDEGDDHAKSDDDGDRAKSDADGDAKSEGDGSAKSEGDGDAKSDGDSDSKSDSDDDAKSNSDGDAKSESDGDGDAKSDGDGEAKSDGDGDAKLEDGGDEKSEGDGDGDAKSEGGGDAKSDGDGEAKSDGDGEAKSDGDGDAKLEDGGDAKSEGDGDGDGDGDAKSEEDGDAKSDEDGDAKSEGDGDAKSDGGGDSGSEDDS